MKFKLFNLALGVVLTATTINASAQKAYTEGTINISTTVGGNTTQSKVYFKGDSSSLAGKAGPATFRAIFAKGGDYAVNIVEVPIANLKKAYIATPAELEELKDKEPTLTFSSTTETKVINGFNCKKVNVKDGTGATSEAWVTNDISVPNNLLTKYYAAAGGFPIQFTNYQMGQKIAVTVNSIVAEKTPAGVFSIPAGYDRSNYTEMMNGMRMMGGRQ